MTEATESLQKCKRESECEPDTHLIRVVHAHSDTFALEIIHVQRRGLCSVCRGEDKLQLPWSWRNEVR